LLPDFFPSSGAHSERRRVNPLIRKVLWIKENNIVVVESKSDEINICAFLYNFSDPFLYVLVRIESNRAYTLGRSNCFSEIAIWNFIQSAELTVNVFYPDSVQRGFCFIRVQSA